MFKLSVSVDDMAMRQWYLCDTDLLKHVSIMDDVFWAVFAFLLLGFTVHQHNTGNTAPNIQLKMLIFKLSG